MIDENKLFPKIEGMLFNYTALINEIKNLELDIEELENDYRGCGSITYEEKTGPTNAFNSSVENEITNKEKKIDNLKRLKRSKEIAVKKIDNALSVLEEREKKVVELRYFNNRKLGWFRIGEILQLSDSTCRVLRSSAIVKMIPVILVSENLR
jgi:DNA-directed RNA polymerase specialized sigma subunit